MSPINTINILIYNSFYDVEAIWRSFEKTSDNYAFQNFDWLKHWHETIGITTKLCLVVVEYPVGKPVMILPLGLEKRYSVDCLVWLGGGFLITSALCCVRIFPRISHLIFLKRLGHLSQCICPLTMPFFLKKCLN